jgi:hypothetical protein
MLSQKQQIILIILIVLAILLLVLFFCSQKQDGQVEDIVEIDDQIEQLPIADDYFSVMIDNATEVRPQNGLEQAQIVYEALAEGSITRLLAIFSLSDLPDIIGPVRSARPYYMSWANDYGGMYMHAGGSPQALQQLASGDWNFADINEISHQGIYFYRDYQKNNPHNLFTSADLIEQAQDKYYEEQEIEQGWNYKDDLELIYRPIEQKYIKLPYQHQNYEVVWTYNREDNTWQRQAGGEVHTDTQGKVLAVNNVIVLVMDTELIDIERLSMQTIGEGSGYLFRDGQKQEIIWTKESNDQSMQLKINDHLIDLNRGKTWINIWPSHLNFEYN